MINMSLQHSFFGHVTPLAPALASHDTSGIIINVMPMVLLVVPILFICQENQKEVQHDLIGHVTLLTPGLVSHDATGISVSIM